MATASSHASARRGGSPGGRVSPRLQVLRLPPGWGTALLCAPGHHRPSRSWEARAYDHLGYQLVWRPGGRPRQPLRVACDIEHRARFSRSLGEAFDEPTGSLLFRRWTATEVVAKCLDVPVILLRTCPAAGPLAGVRDPGLHRMDTSVYGSPGTAHVLVVESAGRIAAFGWWRASLR